MAKTIVEISDGNSLTTYKCSKEGVFDITTNSQVLPAESELFDGNTWRVDYARQTVGFESITVPAGTFNVLRICDSESMEDTCDYYAEGVGFIKRGGNTQSHYELLGFTIP